MPLPKIAPFTAKPAIANPSRHEKGRSTKPIHRAYGASMAETDYRWRAVLSYLSRDWLLWLLGYCELALDRVEPGSTNGNYLAGGELRQRILQELDRRYQ